MRIRAYVMFIIMFAFTWLAFMSLVISFSVGEVFAQAASPSPPSSSGGGGGVEICSSPAFAVKGVRIDETGPTGTAARTSAIAKATSDAFSVLKARMLLLSPPSPPPLISAQAADFVDYIHIRDETALAKRYIAEIDICFNPVLVRAAFGEAGLQWSEILSPPILLLPIWQEPSGIRAWTQDTLWLEIWREPPSTAARLVQFTTLAPDLTIERQLSPMALLDRDPATLTKAAKLADALQIAWVYAQIDYGTRHPTITMTAELYNPDGAFLAEIDRQVVHLNGEVSMAIAFDRFRQNTLDSIDQTWRHANLYSAARLGHIFIEIPVASIDRWYEARQIFARMPIVTSHAVISLSPTRGIVQLQLAGSVEALQIAIRAMGYRLDLGEQGRYILTATSP